MISYPALAWVAPYTPSIGPILIHSGLRWLRKLVSKSGVAMTFQVVIRARTSGY